MDSRSSNNIFKSSLCFKWAPDAGNHYFLYAFKWRPKMGFKWRFRRARCWQGYGFGTTAAGDAGIAGRGTVLRGPPRPETLAGVRFWDQHGRKRWQGHGHGDMVLHTHTDVSPGASQARKANWWVSQGPRQGQTHPPVCAGLRLDQKLGSKLQSCVFVSEHAFP